MTLRFLHPALLWLLLLLPVFALIRGRSGPAPAVIFPTAGLLRLLGGKRKTRPGGLESALRLLTLALLLLALARPQLGRITTQVRASGIDILLAVDISGSMQALDFTLHDRPANRLQVVKSVVSRFIRERPNDRIGLLAFGGRPYLVCPLTLDHDWLQRRLASLEIGMIEDGTAIGSAIASGVNRLREQRSKSKILILLTDGINNAGKVAPLTAAEAAETLGIRVYTIGAGTNGEAAIPMQDPFGRTIMMRARMKIDDETLRKVAEKTGAKYFRATDTGSLKKVYAEINKMETTTRTIKHFSRQRDLFAILVAAAALLLCIEVTIRGKRLP